MRFGHQNQHPQQQQKEQRQQLLLYRYSCSKCGTILKETENPIDSSVFRVIKNERCANCGNILQEQTVAVQQLPSFSQNDSSLYSSSSSPSSSSPPSQMLLPPQLLTLPSLSTTTTFETAYSIQQRRTSTKLIFFDIAEIDSFLDLSDRGGGSICVASSRKSRDGDSWHANNTLVTRLCVRALMPRRYGGFGSPSVIFIDAGNCSDIYKCVSFIRQYGLDQQKTLDRIIVSRPFTIHQLACLIIYEVALMLQRTDARLVVISDLLRMFVQDPQIDPDEARWLVKEIARSLRKLSSQVLVVVSLHEYPPQLGSLLLSLFESQINIATITKEPNRLQVKISYSNNNNLHHRHGSSNSKGQSSSSFIITEKDLQIIRAR
jgi:ribosomal protein S27AE